MKKMLLAVVGVVILAVLAGGGYALHASMNKTNAGSSNTNTNSGSTTTNSPNQAATNQQSADIIQTKTAAGTGTYLADAGGYPLYTYGADTTGVSNCTGSCLGNWPIYSAANAPTTLPASVTVITRSDGSKQYAYKGLPLYTFTLDSLGHVTGDGVAGFHVAKP